MMEPRETSIGSQVDELVAHFIERIDCLAKDVAQINAKTEELNLRLQSTVAIAIICGFIFGILSSLAAPMVGRRKGDMQDGMLAYYLSQAQAADANVEARVAREPFDFRDMSHQDRKRGALPRRPPFQVNRES